MKFTLAVAALVSTTAAADAAKGCKVTVTYFAEKECAKAVDATDALKAVSKSWTDMAAAADGKCVAAGDDFSKITCDGTALSTAVFTDEKCATPKKVDEKAVVSSLAWGKCTEVDTGKTWVKVSGSKALMAGAAALLAFAGSQF